MRRENREVVADRLVVVGAVLLFGSLFLTWSHQLPREFLVLFGTAEKLQGVPRDPTGWQVYSSADLALALFAAGLLVVVVIGRRNWRIASFGGAFAALVFVVSAIASPPTVGVGNLFNPANSVPRYVPVSPGAGLGETVALLALVLAIGGLGLGLAPELPTPESVADRTSSA